FNNLTNIVQKKKKKNRKKLPHIKDSLQKLLTKSLVAVYFISTHDFLFNKKTSTKYVEVFLYYSPNPGIIMNSVYQVNPIINTVKYDPNIYIYILSESFK